MNGLAEPGEVLVSRTEEDGHIELTVSSASLSPSRIYAYPLVDSLVDFFKQLRVDAGVADGAVELVASSGSVISSGMAHAFAWKPGRSLRLGSELLALSFCDSTEGAPLMRRLSSANPTRIESDKAPMKYVVVSGGVVSGLGKGITASSLGAAPPRRAPPAAGSAVPLDRRGARGFRGAPAPVGLPRHLRQDRPLS